MAATKRLYSLLANNIGKALANDNPNILAVMCQCLKADNPKRFNEAKFIGSLRAAFEAEQARAGLMTKFGAAHGEPAPVAPIPTDELAKARSVVDNDC